MFSQLVPHMKFLFKESWSLWRHCFLITWHGEWQQFALTQICGETRFVFPTSEGKAAPNYWRKHPHRVSGLKFFLFSSSLYISINISLLLFILACFWSQILWKSAKVQIPAAVMRAVSNWMGERKLWKVSHNATWEDKGPRRVLSCGEALPSDGCSSPFICSFSFWASSEPDVLQCTKTQTQVLRRFSCNSELGLACCLSWLKVFEFFRTLERRRKRIWRFSKWLQSWKYFVFILFAVRDVIYCLRSPVWSKLVVDFLTLLLSESNLSLCLCTVTG